MEAVTLTVEKLGSLDASYIASRLTNIGSEFHMEVKQKESSTPIALVRDGGARVASWAATHEWRGMQTIEGFTDETFRRRGLARLASALLVADGHVDPDRTVAVFSPFFVEIARSVGCHDVRLFERHGDDWIENS